jgi:hypothetical protein
LVSTQLEHFPRIVSSKITVEQGKLTTRIRLHPDQTLQDNEDEQRLFAEIKEFLWHSLPYYMIPQTFFVLENSNTSSRKTSPAFQLQHITSFPATEELNAKGEKHQQNYRNRTNNSFFGSLWCCYCSRAVIG